MKDVLNNDLIIGQEYCYYIDQNAICVINYGVLTNFTKTGLATILVTKTETFIGNNFKGIKTVNQKKSVKPFKLIKCN